MPALKDSRTLFFTTSPRTPTKMIPEIALLVEHFTNKKWNPSTQTDFMKLLAEDPSFLGEGSVGLTDFSARDRINRSPKALGFVDLNPCIKLTDAGKSLLSGVRVEETLLRQMLKFQIPSPYHWVIDKTVTNYNVKPYLEMIRLIHGLGSISFDEIMMFGLQMTDYRKYDEVVAKIYKYRKDLENKTIGYKEFVRNYANNVVCEIYAEDLESGNTRTRESTDSSEKAFINKKRRNMRDYTDACFRYLRATGLISISHRNKALSIIPERVKDVEYILETVDRKPVFIDDEKKYKEMLFNASTPALYSDNKESLVSSISEIDGVSPAEYSSKSVNELKDILTDRINSRKQAVIDKHINDLKDYKEYDSILEIYDEILNEDLYDKPLMLEWNTWRAMTMLDNGNISGNFNMDDFGKPLSTAAGNMPDITCDYSDFSLTVEVTMQTGQRQYESEAEPVARHLANYKKSTDKPTYCLFIAPRINEAAIAHFYSLHQIAISYYGGKSVIIPVPLENYIDFVKHQREKDSVDVVKTIKSIFLKSEDFVSSNDNKTEEDWYKEMQSFILSA